MNALKLLIKILLFNVLCTLSFSSCIVINSTGFTSGYAKLTPEEQTKVVYAMNIDSIVHIKNDGKIYVITGKQLKEMLLHTQNVIVYMWAPHCSSVSCLSLRTVQNYCTEHHLELFVIAEYYTDTFVQNSFLRDHPLFSINGRYYNTDVCTKYHPLFLQECLGENWLNLNKDTRYYSYFHFIKGKYVRNYRNLEDIVAD